MTTGAYDIATEHAILAEASSAGALQAVPAALLFGVLLGALYDIFRMISAALGVREDTGTDGGRLRPYLLCLRRYRCRSLRCPKSAASDGMQTGFRKPRRRIPAQVLQGMLDILYFLICGVLGAVFLYWRNDGILRWYLLLCGGIGFYAYSRSIGKLVMPLFLLLTALLRAGICALYNGILYFPLRIVCRVLSMLGKWSANAGRAALQTIQNKRNRRRIRRILCAPERSRADPVRHEHRKRKGRHQRRGAEE